jgi:predicted chitinase
MHDFDINTRRRAAMFIAQVAHESGGFRYREEIASGAAYEGRRDLGNTHPGDGVRFKGRTYIQITGRTNYAADQPRARRRLRRAPRQARRARYAAKGAAWWWKTHGCNQLADTGDFVALTRRINGGTNGLADRQAYYRRARLVAIFLVPKRRKP